MGVLPSESDCFQLSSIMVDIQEMGLLRSVTGVYSASSVRLPIGFKDPLGQSVISTTGVVRDDVTSKADNSGDWDISQIIRSTSATGFRLQDLSDSTNASTATTVSVDTGSLTLSISLSFSGLAVTCTVIVIIIAVVIFKRRRKNLQS